MSNYPSSPPGPRRVRRDPQSGSANRYLPPIEESRGHSDAPRRDGGVGRSAGRGAAGPPRGAAQRGRDVGSKMYGLFHRAATADGADKSGLTALTYPVMANFAADSAMAIALADTLFFAAAQGESKGKVALYLLITIAPFAVIAPLIGPALDRVQHGRRVALAMSFVARTVLAVVLIAYYAGGSFPSWVLYPCALGMMVLSKSFSVLRSAMTPRVLPPTIDLVRVNSRLTMFGLIGGTIVGGGVAVAFQYGLKFIDVPGALYVCVAVTVAGAVFAMRIPKWVEVTEGEVPTTLSYHEPTALLRRDGQAKPARQPLGRNIITSLWGNCTIKIMVGFLFLYPAFVAQADADASGWEQIKVLGLIGAAAGIGNFVGNMVAARLKLGDPSKLVVWSAIAVSGVALATALAGNIIVAAIATLVTSGASAIAKACLDASLQDDLPEESRASAFGRSESLLQLAWVIGGATGVLVFTDLWVGFTAITALLIPGLAQTLVSYNGDSLIPGLGGNRPVVAQQAGWRASPAGAAE